MRELWDGTIGGSGAAGAVGIGAEVIDADALGRLTADDDLLQRLFDFTLEHGPTVMDFDSAEARAGYR